MADLLPILKFNNDEKVILIAASAMNRGRETLQTIREISNLLEAQDTEAEACRWRSLPRNQNTQNMESLESSVGIWKAVPRASMRCCKGGSSWR